jgi:hypothetical protein
MNSKNNFESLGAHLRNLLTPYANLIQLANDLLNAKREGNEEELNKIFNMMNVYDFNNIQDIIDFSFIEQMELINWRDSKLYHMQQALEMMKEQENNG